MAGLFTARKVTSSRRAELLTTWRGSWMLEICGPIGTMRGCTGLIDDNLINKNNQCSTHHLPCWNYRLKQVTSSKFDINIGITQLNSYYSIWPQHSQTTQYTSCPVFEGLSHKCNQSWILSDTIYFKACSCLFKQNYWIAWPLRQKNTIIFQNVWNLPYDIASHPRRLYLQQYCCEPQIPWIMISNS